MALGELEVAVGIAHVAIVVSQFQVVAVERSVVEVNIVAGLSPVSVISHLFDRGTLACRPHAHYTRAALQPAGTSDCRATGARPSRSAGDVTGATPARRVQLVGGARD